MADKKSEGISFFEKLKSEGWRQVGTLLGYQIIINQEKTKIAAVTDHSKDFSAGPWSISDSFEMQRTPEGVGTFESGEEG